jgi:hypothetical protein
MGILFQQKWWTSAVLLSARPGQMRKLPRIWREKGRATRGYAPKFPTCRAVFPRNIHPPGHKEQASRQGRES